jgi:hypothetical protein
MLHNRNKEALHQLFMRCGSHLLSEREKRNYRIFGKYGVSRLRKACYAYFGKSQQAFKLKDQLLPSEILFVEYDELVRSKHALLPLVYDFIDLPYKAEYADKLHEKSIMKATKLPNRKKEVIDSFCQPVYEEAVASLISKKHIRNN